MVRPATNKDAAITAFINQYNLLDTVSQVEQKTVLGKQIGFDSAVVLVVLSALAALPALNPGATTPGGMAQQLETIEALMALRTAVQQLTTPWATPSACARATCGSWPTRGPTRSPPPPRSSRIRSIGTRR